MATRQCAAGRCKCAGRVQQVGKCVRPVLVTCPSVWGHAKANACTKFRAHGECQRLTSRQRLGSCMHACMLVCTHAIAAKFAGSAQSMKNSMRKSALTSLCGFTSRFTYRLQDEGLLYSLLSYMISPFSNRSADQNMPWTWSRVDTFMCNPDLCKIFLRASRACLHRCTARTCKVCRLGGRDRRLQEITQHKQALPAVNVRASAALPTDTLNTPLPGLIVPASISEASVTTPDFMALQSVISLAWTCFDMCCSGQDV